MLDQADEFEVLITHTKARSELLVKQPPYRMVWVEPGVEPGMGAWTFRQEEEIHEILLNRTLDERADQCDDRAGLAKHVYHHEIAHSLWTERDFARLHRALKEGAPEVPLRLLNLFEDARIEALWRRLTGLEFVWTRWFHDAWKREPGRGLEDLRAEEFFLHLVQTEGCTRALSRLLELAEEVSTDLVIRIERIFWYYLKATEEEGSFSKSALALIPLCREWMDEFGLPKDRGAASGLLGNLGKDPADGGGRQPHHTPVHGGDLLSPEELDLARAKPREKSGSEVGIALVGNSSIKMDALFTKNAHRGKFDAHKADSLEPYLARVLNKGEGCERSIAPRKRFSTRDHVRGSQRVYRGKTRDAPTPSRLMYLHDCSGSMGKEPAQLSGLTMLQLVNRLHRQHLIEAKAYLCFGGFGELALPFEEDLLNDLVSRGPREGFEGCLKANESVVRWADRVMVYTDGRIGDKPIDRERWRREGVESYGMLVGDASKSDPLHRWFDHVIVRPSIEDLVVALAELIRREFR